MGTFPRDATVFLQDLQKNNDRAWFKEHQARYEASIREPARAFIRDVGDWLGSQGLPYVAVDKKVGGSLAKIQRDVRFSNDKTPYHDHITMHFSHRDGSRDNVMPAFGIRFGPDSVGLGGGVWQAPTPILNKIRDGIIADPEGWQAAKANLDFDAERLKNAPRGYDKAHPLVEDLKLKGFLGHVPLQPKDIHGDLLATVASKGKPIFDYLAWLEKPLKVA